MAFCTNCGNELKENEKFCPECGAEQVKTGSAEAPYIPPSLTFLRQARQQAAIPNPPPSARTRSAR
ncbi:MAG: zinc ribbon domain-containing protein [Clostridia bacterium]|nr:zinc ribbon domain-containing protein [Clostridia bacterium]